VLLTQVDVVLVVVPTKVYPVLQTVQPVDAGPVAV